MSKEWRDDRMTNDHPTAFRVAWRAVDRDVHESGMYRLSIAHVLDSNWKHSFMASIKSQGGAAHRTGWTHADWKSALNEGKQIIETMQVEDKTEDDRE